jgi:hypothetical protein
MLCQLNVLKKSFMGENQLKIDGWEQFLRGKHADK